MIRERVIDFCPFWKMHSTTSHPIHPHHFPIPSYLLLDTLAPIWVAVDDLQQSRALHTRAKFIASVSSVIETDPRVLTYPPSPPQKKVNVQKIKSINNTKRDRNSSDTTGAVDGTPPQQDLSPAVSSLNLALSARSSGTRIFHMLRPQTSNSLEKCASGTVPCRRLTQSSPSKPKHRPSSVSQKILASRVSYVCRPIKETSQFAMQLACSSPFLYPTASTQTYEDA